MYIRLLNFETRDNRTAELTAIMDDIMPKIKALGAKDCKFMIHEDDNHYGLIVYWDSKAKADAAAPIIAPQLLPALNKFTTENVVHRLYEVYEPVLTQVSENISN
jgi:hypothetical protein